MAVVKSSGLRDLPEIGQLVVAPWGLPGSGKTHFALTFPGPIRIINTDFGLKEVVRKFPDKDIQWADFLITTNSLEHGRMLQNIVDTYQAYLEELRESGGTVVIDTVTQLWQLTQSVKLEEVRARKAKKKGVDTEDVQIHQFDYAQANSWQGAFLRMIMSTQYSKVNGVFISRSAPEYSGSESTGRQTMQGYRELQSIVQLVIEVYEPEVQQKKYGGAGKITKCRFDDHHSGDLIGKGALNYEYLKQVFLDEDEQTP